MMIIGIDVGKNGGIAILKNERFEGGKTQCEVFPYSDDKLLSILAQSPYRTIVESVHAMPGQGVTSMFNFGKSFGYILGALEQSKTEYLLVRPQEWKKEYSLIGKDKSASIEKARELFPKVNLYRTPRCKKEHDGMAEALLIAEYGRRKCKDTTP